MHDVQAFVDDAAIRQYKDGDGALGAGGEHFGRLVAQEDFADADGQAGGGEGHPGAHGIGAAAEGIEDRHGSRDAGAMCFSPRALARSIWRWRSAKRARWSSVISPMQAAQEMPST